LAYQQERVTCSIGKATGKFGILNWITLRRGETQRSAEEVEDADRNEIDSQGLREFIESKSRKSAAA